MKFLTNPLSSNGRRVALAIAHLGVDVPVEVVDFATGAHKAPEFLKVNPNGQLPAFTDGDLHLWESNAIATYIVEWARAQGNAAAEGLLPSDPAGRADVVRWQCWQLAKWDAATGPIGFEAFVKPTFFGQPTNAERLASAQALFRKHAAVLEASLAGRDWLVGEAVSLADYAVAVGMQAADVAPYPIDEFPAVQAWFERVRATTAWTATDPGAFVKR